MAGNVKLMTSAGGGVVLDTATTTATDVTVKVPVTGVNNGTLVCSDSSGNVGINTSTAPSGAGVKLIVNNPSGNGGIQLNSGATTGGGALIPPNGAGLTFFTYTGAIGSETYTERMRIDSSGNLLVGTSAPTLTARISSQNNGWAAYLACTGTGGGNIPAILERQQDNGTAIEFKRSGNVVGAVTVTATNTTYATSSDYRLKDNIQPMTGALSKVAALKPCTYTWKADGSAGEGFIAHELQEVVPQCVTGEKDAVDAEGKPVYQGIDTSFLVATLTKAIQELNEKVEAQAAEIAALKGAA